MKDVLVPDIGDFKEVEVIEILVKPGDTVAKEQSLVSLESDKATMEIPSPEAGIVKELKIKVGDKVSEGSVLLLLEPAGVAPAVVEEAPEAKKTEEAAEMFRQVNAAEVQLRRKQKLIEELERSPDPVNQRYEIAIIAMNHESPEEGLRWLLTVIDMDPGHAGAYAALADYYRKIGNDQLEQKFRMLAESSRSEKGTP